MPAGCAGDWHVRLPYQLAAALPLLQVRRLGVELMRTARELHKTLASPPQPSGKRTTMHHTAGDSVPGTAGSALPTPGSRSGLPSRAGLPSRRATAAHAGPGGDAAGAAGMPGDSVPATPSGQPRVVYAADVIDRCAAVADCGT